MDPERDSFPLPPRGAAPRSRLRGRWRLGRPSTVVAVPLALAVGALMLLSPLGADLFTDLGLPSPASVLGSVFDSFLAMFPSAQKVSALPANQVLDVGVGVPLHDPNGLQSFIQATSTPGSPDYGHFLSPSQFDSLYAPSASAYASDVRYFEQYGVHVQTSSDRLLLGLTGTPADLGAAFHTTFAEYSLNGEMFYGTTSTATLPPDLDVDGSFGLTNAFDYTPTEVLAPSSASSATASPASTAAACTGGDTPTEVQDAYRVNELTAAGDEGSGYGIAVVDAYDTAQKPTALTTDLNDFDTDCGMAATTPQYQYPVPFPTDVNTSASSEWGGETVLDMQWSHAMAQEATLYPVQTPDAGDSLYTAVNYLVATHLVDVISLSWGEPLVGEYEADCTSACNATGDDSMAMFHPVLMAAAAEGISVTVASGDCGADDGSSVPSPDYPASDVDATGIGGSVLTLAANDTWYGSESTTSPTTGTCKDTSQWCGNWTYTNCDNGGAAGGGWATFPQPWYQSGPGIVNKGLRGVPDVGITVGQPLATYYGGAGEGIYGTSDGAPQWAGLIATADGIAGHDVGLINPALYAMLRSPNYQYYFHQVTTGLGNGYAPTADWSPISGVGTPIASNVVPYIAHGGYLLPASNLQAGLSASTTSGAAPLTVTFTTTATGGTGTYRLYNFYWGDDTSVSTKTNVLSHTYTSAGTYAAQGEVFDSSSNSTLTQAIMITVGTTPTLSLSLAASTTTPTVGESVTFTATTTGGTSPFTFGYYFGDGTYVFGGYNAKQTSPNSVGHEFREAGTYCVDASANDSSDPQLGATSNVVTVFVGGASGPCDARLTAPTLSFNRTNCELSCGVALNLSFTGSLPSFTTTIEWGDGTAPTAVTGAVSSLMETHQYRSTGTFDPRVFVNDSVGESVSTLSATDVQVDTLLGLTGVAPSSWHGEVPGNLTWSSTVSGGAGGVSYAWSFPYGNLSSLASGGDQIYLHPGAFSASLTVTDAFGYRASETVAFSVWGNQSTAIVLYAGWNFIAIPTQGNDYTLYELSVEVGPAAFLSVQDVHDTTTTTYLRPADAGNGNAAAPPGDGLWVDVSVGVTLTLYGTATASLSGIATTGGSWSAVGWSVTGSTTAQVLAAQFAGAESISIWNAQTQTWTSYLVNFDTSSEYDFTISAGEAVMVFAATSGSLTE